jgi:hypothetical protein
MRREAHALRVSFAAAERGEEQERERRRRPMLADRPRQRDAVHLRHVHVQDADVEGLVGLDPAQGVARRARE